MRGRVKWWLSDRGYGFVLGDDKQDYFVHYTDVMGEGRKDLTPYAAVDFVPAKNAKGLKAVQVRTASEDGLGGMNDSTQSQDAGREAGTP